MRAAIYSRYSTDLQDETSIAGQIANCEALAAQKGFDVVARYQDAAQSGNDDNRPQYQQMFADSEDPLGKDLALFARKLGFVEFDGFSEIERSVGTYWRYHPNYEWESLTKLTIEWRYES